MIAGDAIRPMYDHVRELAGSGKHQRLTLFLYSLGGSLDIPWKLVTMFRAHTDEFHVVVPYKAYSAATMITLGADKIWMTKKAELGPIDPSIRPAGVNAPGGPFSFGELGSEDVTAYLRFVRERAGISDQHALAQLVGSLASNLTPVLLGKVERIYSHIRLVAKKLLSQHRPPMTEQSISQIIDALTEKTYVHGHGIGRQEAKELGLDVGDLDGKAEDAAWELYLEYEKLLKLRDSTDPMRFFTDDGPDKYVEQESIASIIESAKRLDTFTGRLVAERVRGIPEHPNININMNIGLPPGIDVNQLPQTMPQIIDQQIQQASRSIRGLVEEQLRLQSPIKRIVVKMLGGKWQQIT